MSEKIISNFKEKTNNSINCLTRLGHNAHSVNRAIRVWYVKSLVPEYQANTTGSALIIKRSQYVLRAQRVEHAQCIIHAQCI